MGEARRRKIIFQMDKDKPVIMAHVVSGQEALKFSADVGAFCEGKKILTKVINTTPVIAGVSRVGNMGQANTILVFTAFIEWECTLEESRAFINQQKLLLNKPTFQP